MKKNGIVTKCPFLDENVFVSDELEGKESSVAQRKSEYIHTPESKLHVCNVVNLGTEAGHVTLLITSYDAAFSYATLWYV